MENSVLQPTNNENFNKFSIPVKWGIIIGIVGCILSTINLMFLVDIYYVFIIMNIVMFIVCVILYWLTGVQQRKAMGGYIDIKQAFQAIFIAILISSIITTIYGIIYTKVIDPGVVERIKAGTLGFMERMNAPDESIDEAAAKIDAQVLDSTKPGTLVLSFAKSLVITSIFGFICALIVRKKKPEYMA
ncbi:MAG TPA: DUF4199 domain-containing protein [Flavipsychrobacter sp.]|jgi:hypothetical protein|nr:DUF4199 domain-containing protein [Flavipsychrobacter sp.]